MMERKMRVTAGPGDSSTWGPCTGHPNDPRTEVRPEKEYTERECVLLNRVEYCTPFPEKMISAEAENLDDEEIAYEISGVRWMEHFVSMTRKGRADEVFHFFRSNLIEDGRRFLLGSCIDDDIRRHLYLVTEAVEMDDTTEFVAAAKALIDQAAHKLATENLEIKARNFWWKENAEKEND
jgi:hypothetical protein